MWTRRQIQIFQCKILFSALKVQTVTFPRNAGILVSTQESTRRYNSEDDIVIFTAGITSNIKSNVTVKWSVLFFLYGGFCLGSLGRGWLC
jgi:hypothetical protein